MTPQQVVIVGGGFGGLYAVLSLKNAPVRVTLLDRRNFHLFQPLLYQVATGWLSPANIASPLRAILKNQKNTKVLLAEVSGFDIENRRVILQEETIGYDTLVVATGSTHHYFGNDGWEKIAPGLKCLEDALEIRKRILTAFEAAERETVREHVEAWLTFVVVGGGPTGVELAGALGEIANDTLRGDFRTINPGDAKIFLIETQKRILPPYPPELSAQATAALNRLGVTVRTETMVTELHDDRVIVRCGERDEPIATHTVLWSAGVQASPLGKALAEATGADVDRSGRIKVEADFSIPGHPDILVIGDLAHFSHQGNKPLPALAPVAMQQGRYAAKVVQSRLRGKKIPPFHYKDYGTMATIGRGAAVADLGRFRLSGYFAWLAWLFLHLMYLVEFENRVLVFIQWAWAYVTRNRAARIILKLTGSDKLR